MSVPKKIVAVTCLPTIAVIIGLFLIYCAEDTPDRCGDGQPLNTYTQFCYGGVTYDKCGGNDYKPSTHFCDVVSGTTYLLCGGKDYLPATEFCTTGVVYSKCAGAGYAPATQFCDANVLYDKCGDKPYLPATEFCVANTVYTKCGGATYDPTTHGCENDMPRRKCGNTVYDTTARFCDNGTLYDLCGGNTYAPATQFCFNNIVHLKCAGEAYDLTTHGCVDNVILARCGSNFYDDATRFCNNATVYDLCGGKDYTPATEFCFANIVYEKCAGQDYDPTTERCVFGVVLPQCGNAHYNPATEFCHNNTVTVDKCNGATFNYDLLFCHNNALYPRCGNKTYDPLCQICDDTGNITDTCALTVWYDITFNGNGAIMGVPEGMRAYYDSSITLPAAMERHGYNFIEWNTRDDGTGTKLAAGATYTVINNVTFYAMWTPKTYTVRFNGNGATSGVPDTIDGLYERNITLPLQGSMTNGDLVFGGWNTHPSGTGTNYAAGTSYQVTGNVTLYARWSDVSVVLYTVTFDGNGATSGVPTPMSTEQGNSVTLPQQGTMTITGYTFSGWSTSRSGGTTHAAGTAYTVTGDGTLYARWTPTNYTISYTLNSGTVSPANRTSYNIETATFTLNNPTRTGHTFSGWTGTGITGSSMLVTIEQGNIGNRSYTANWTVNNYTITFDGNGATGDVPAAINAVYNSTIILPAQGNMTRDEYFFDQWNTTASGTGTRYLSGASYRVTGNATLYVTWVPINFTDTRDGNVYRSVTIGTQIWMAENLNYADVGACYDNEESNCAIYGRLYTWAEAMDFDESCNTATVTNCGATITSPRHRGVCPAGWHLPSRGEWQTLLDFDFANSSGNQSAGRRLKSRTTWNTGGGSSDDYGFSALAGGRRNPDGSFQGIGTMGRWWTATASTAPNAWYRTMSNNESFVRENTEWKTTGFSVRCVRD